MAGNAAALVQHNNRWEALDAMTRAAEERGEALIRSRQIADEGCRASFGDIGKLDQRPRPRRAGADQ